MKTRILTTTAIALMLAAPAFAQTYSNDRTTGTWSADANDRTDNTHSMGSRAPGASTNTVTGRAESAVSDDNIQATILDADYDRGAARYVTAEKGDTAKGIIGKTAYNADGDRIATIDDIIVDQTGQAKMVVLAEGGFLGLGKKQTAFDYQMITRRDKDDEIVLPLTKKAIQDAPVFSYDTEDSASVNTRTVPANSFRLSEILDADVMDPAGKDVGDVDDATLRAGQVDYLVVSSGETLGVGGKQAALPYSTVKMTGKMDDLNVSLSQEQARRLDKFVREKVSSNY